MVDQVFQDRTSEKAQMLILLINAGFIQVSYHIFFSYMYICLVLRIMYMKKILEHLMHYILHHKHTSASHIYSSSMN